MVLDANILIYAYDSESSRHERVRGWLERTLTGDELVGLPLVTALAFLRIVTNPAIMRAPIPAAEANMIVERIAARQSVRLIEPTSRHWKLLAEVADDGRAKGPLLTDAHITALALEHGATVVTTDRVFARFKGVKTYDPSES